MLVLKMAKHPLEELHTFLTVQLLQLQTAVSPPTQFSTHFYTTATHCSTYSFVSIFGSRSNKTVKFSDSNYFLYSAWLECHRTCLSVKNRFNCRISSLYGCYCNNNMSQAGKNKLTSSGSLLPM